MSKDDLIKAANVTTKEVEKLMLPIRGQQVLIDRDVADLYGVETKRINEAVKNNPEKFPDGYIFALSDDETEEYNSIVANRNVIAVENFDRKEISKMSRYVPKAFTERGLYMLATILKSPQATKTTIAIIDTFAKVKELGRHLDAIHNDSECSESRAAHAERAGQLLSEILANEISKGNHTGIELNMMSISITQNKKTK